MVTALLVACSESDEAPVAADASPEAGTTSSSGEPKTDSGVTPPAGGDDDDDTDGGHDPTSTDAGDASIDSGYAGDAGNKADSGDAVYSLDAGDAGADSGPPISPPVCGDGTCNGAETQASCCTDCGCPSGQSCSGGTCKCTQGTVHMTSGLHDTAQSCVTPGGTVFPYTQRAVCYVNTGGQLYFIPEGGYIDFTDPIPRTMTGTQQACALDPCLGNASCPTPSGNQTCFCLAQKSLSVTINTCSINSIVCN